MYGENYTCESKTCYNDVYDNTAEYASTEVVIINPPAAPVLSSPRDNGVLYYPESQSDHTPELKWNEISDWGWAPSGSDSKKIVLNVLNKNNDLVCTKDGSSYSSTSEYSDSLPDGSYSWTVTAYLGSIDVKSASWSFEVCTVSHKGDVVLTSPSKDAYVTDKKVEFKWEEPAGWAYCGEKDLYNYTVIVQHGTSTYNETVVKRGQNSIIIAIDNDGDYFWKVQANGPLGQVSDPNPIKFTFCTPEKPSPPRGVKIDNYDVDASCVTSGGSMRYAFSWTAPEKTGKNCLGPDTTISNYKVKLCSSKSCSDGTDVTQACYEADIPCGDESYSLHVWAYNGHDYSESTVVPFSVCQNIAPGGVVVDDIPMSYCRETTKIAWAHDDWGKSCPDSSGEDEYIFTFTQGGTVVTETIPREEGNSHTHDFSLSDGEWKVDVVASGKNGLNSTVATKTFNASKLVVIKGRTATNFGSEVEFSWETEEVFVDCAGSGSYEYELHYNCGEIQGSKPVEFGRYAEVNVSSLSGVVIWCIKLKKGSEVILDECEKYNVDENCVEVKPRWDNIGDVIESPKGSGLVVGSVAFAWKKAYSGISCKDKNPAKRDLVIDNDAKEGYRVIVDGVEKSETNETACTIEIGETGNHTWRVVAFVGDVTSEPANHATFCLASSPVTPVILEYDPYKPNIVSWVGTNCKYHEASTISYLELYSSLL